MCAAPALAKVIRPVVSMPMIEVEMEACSRCDISPVLLRSAVTSMPVSTA